ncbi:hypothetical protein [Enterovibrio sp. 27052020O]|uniref:hypothetical protein n=1 Tax=Enterovibrio sp. 27052020O TaxID=3241166 RepID=UPI00388FCD09
MNRFYEPGRKKFVAKLSVAALTSGKSIGCDFAFDGRVFLIPMKDGKPTTEATGTIELLVELGGVKEAIQFGTVNLAKLNPPTYEKPRWGGSADSLYAKASEGAVLEGFDELKLIIERF